MSSASKSSKSKQTNSKKGPSKEEQEKKEDLEAKKELGYLDSTQCKHWLLPSLQAVQQRQLSSFKTQINLLKTHDSTCPIPTDEEYLISLSYYCKEIIEICRKFRFPPYVSCTSVTYFKRFFLNEKWNLINIDPVSMKDTCIYLASKTEQCLFTGIDQLTQVTKTPSMQVIDNELILMDGINFHIKIWNPQRPFRSFFTDFKGVYKRKTKKVLNERYEQQILKQGNDCMQDAYISDVCLIYTPSQIALSCLLMAISSFDVTNFKKEEDKKEIEQIKKMADAYFKERFAGKGDVDKQKRMSLLQQTIGRIQKNDY